MDDLISRQAAIDATCAACSYDNCRYRDNGVKHASCDYVDRLKRLPPVEQKQCEEDYPDCRECKHYDHEKHHCPRFCAVIRDALAEVEQKQRWIPVSERLPEKDGEYLVTVKPTFKNMRNYIKHCDFARNLYLVDEYDFVDKKGAVGFYEYDSEYGYYEMTEVIAWMPLPEPYKMCGGDNE